MLIIRPILPEDVEELAKLYDKSVKSQEMDLILEPSSKPFFQRCASLKPVTIHGFETDVVINVAVNNGSIVGFAANKFKPSSEWKGASGKKLTELWLLVVYPEDREKKIGGQLLDVQIQTALTMARTCDSPYLIVRCAPGKKIIVDMIIGRGFTSVASPDRGGALFFERKV